MWDLMEDDDFLKGADSAGRHPFFPLSTSFLLLSAIIDSLWTTKRSEGWKPYDKLWSTQVEGPWDSSNHGAIEQLETNSDFFPLRTINF